MASSHKDNENQPTGAKASNTLQLRFKGTSKKNDIPHRQDTPYVSF